MKYSIKADLPACLEYPLFSPVADDGLPVRHRALHGGRGSAKSHGFGRGLLVRGFVKPERIACYREIQKSIGGSVKALLDDLIPQMGFGPTNGDGFYQSLDTEIRGRNGTTVNFAGLRTNIESVKSTEGITIAYVNEARKVSQNSIKVLMPTIRVKGSEIWWDWNPENEDDPVDAMFRGGAPPPGSIVREVNYTENPWFGEPMRSEMLWDKERDPDRYNHVWLGQYRKQSAGAVFRNWRVETFETPAKAIFRLGADWGFANDPSVLVRAFVGHWDAENGVAIPDLAGRCLFVDYEAAGVGVDVEDTPALFAGDCPAGKRDQYGRPLWENPAGYKGVPGALDWQITADSARPETVSHMRRKGFRMKAAIKGPGSIEDGVAFLKGFEIIVHPRCVLTERELRKYSYEIDPITEEVLSALADKDNNTIDALRYALEGLRKAPRRAPVQPSGNPADLNQWRQQKSSGSSWKTA